MTIAIDRMTIDGGSDGLAKLAAAGDREAFARLVGANYDLVFRMAWRWSGNREDAEDIAQDVCIRLGRAIRGFRGDSAFSTWLCTMTLNAVRDHARRTVRQRRLAEAVHVQALMQQSLPETSDPVEALWEAVRELPEKQRDAVLLVHGEGLNHAAAALAMNCSESTVSWHIHAARKRLRLTLRGGEAND
jgi:RNA polymerase sigma-70 factor (ECF subfamily)